MNLRTSSVIHAPEIGHPSLTWFNVPAPLSLAQLRGRVVILDFWTYCCINCVHVLPSLRRVEEAFPREVVVIGIHSPKFPAERETANVVEAIRRNGIVHPVAHDPELRTWRNFAVKAWPTLVFISPDGYVVGHAAGEPDPDRLLNAVAGLVRGAQETGDLRPADLAAAAAAEPLGRFRYPGKLKPIPGSAGHWAVADSGHNQIVILDGEGGELQRFGSGRGGLVDGPAGDASFDSPQGLAASPGELFVADTGNHAVRRIDLATGVTTTIGGTGRRGRILGEPSDALVTALASPWDLETDGQRLFVANAGTHQIAELDPALGTIRALAGTGAEALVDGPAMTAALAQPSGLAFDRSAGILYFVDSETSATRRLSLSDGVVDTLVGRGLFDFGHVNGSLAAARLQHPLGIALVDGGLLIADSYNAALRRIDLRQHIIVDLDDGFQCKDPVCLPLAEPAGIAADGDRRVLVVDTNNHRIVEYDLATRIYRTWAI